MNRSPNKRHNLRGHDERIFLRNTIKKFVKSLTEHDKRKPTIITNDFDNRIAEARKKCSMMIHRRSHQVNHRVLFGSIGGFLR